MRNGNPWMPCEGSRRKRYFGTQATPSLLDKRKMRTESEGKQVCLGEKKRRRREKYGGGVKAFDKWGRRRWYWQNKWNPLLLQVTKGEVCWRRLDGTGAIKDQWGVERLSSLTQRWERTITRKVEEKRATKKGRSQECACAYYLIGCAESGKKHKAVSNIRDRKGDCWEKGRRL